MKKILLLLCTLLGSVGVWAQETVIVVDGTGTNAPFDTYGTRNTGVSPQTFTSKAASGLAGVVLSAPVIDRATWWDTYCLALRPAATQTDEEVTITAPSGYKIVSISMTLRANSSSYPYDVKFNGSTTTVTGAQDFAFSKSDINATSFSFTINHKVANFHATNKWLAVKSMFIVMKHDNYYDDALAAITDGGTYHISTTIAGTKYYVTTTGKLTSCVADGGSFQFEKVTGGSFETYGYKIKNGSNRFTNAPLNNSSKAVLNVNNLSVTTNNRADWEAQVLYLNDEGKYAIRACNTASALSGWNDAGRVFWTVDGTTARYSYAPAYIWEIEEPGEPVNVTFNFYFGGNKVHSSAVSMEEGAAAIIPASLDYGFCTYSYSPTTITSGITSVDVTTTWNGPFEISEDYASAHWYDMAIRETWYVTSQNKDEDALKTVNANALGLAEDDYQWAFTGDPWHIKVLNKYEGSTKCFGHPSETNEGVPVFGTDNYTWAIKKSTSNIANSFLMNVEGTNLSINQYGGAGGSLKFWDSGNNISDPGSAFTVFDVPTDFSTYVASEISPYFETTAKYFVLSDDAKSAIGYDDDYKTECPFATYKTMKETLLAKVADDANYVWPTTGYYLIESNYYSGKYMAYKDFVDSETPANSGAKLGTITNPASAAAIVKLTAGDDHKYTISVAGLYASAPATSVKIGLAEGAVNFLTEIQDLGTCSFTKDGSDRAIHCADSQDFYNVGWGNNAAASLWKVTDATSIDVTISEAGYATLCVPFAVTIPSGVEAYAVSSLSGNLLTLAEIETTIPAETPVILKGAANTYTFTITTGGSYDGDNILTGTYIDYTTVDNDCVLQNHNDTGVGFYRVDTKEATPKVPANRAYLPASVSAGVKAFFFDQADAIKSVFSGIAEGKIFDLSGRKVAKMQKGKTYIVNGKKVNVK